MLVDVIIIAILSISIFIGYKRGLIEIGVKLFAVIIALLLTLGLYRPISKIIIDNTNLDETIERGIINKTEEILNLSTDVEIDEKLLTNTPRELSLNIVRTIVILCIYVCTKIALMFVKSLANIIAKLPILNQFNQLGGIIFGAIRGIIIIYVVLLIISFVLQINPNNRIQLEIEKSLIGKELYKHNLIQLLVN